MIFYVTDLSRIFTQQGPIQEQGRQKSNSSSYVRIQSRAAWSSGLKYICCKFQPAFGCTTLLALVKICFSIFCMYLLDIDLKMRQNEAPIAGQGVFSQKNTFLYYKKTIFQILFFWFFSPFKFQREKKLPKMFLFPWVNYCNCFVENKMYLWISNEVDINTVLCPIIFNSNTIELTVHTSCFWGSRLTLC